MATTGQTFWSFVWYVKHNPFKALGGMSEADLDAMATLFAAENTTEVSDLIDPGGTYSDIEWPGGIAAKQDAATIDQADYPEYRAGAR